MDERSCMARSARAGAWCSWIRPPARRRRCSHVGTACSSRTCPRAAIGLLSCSRAKGARTSMWCRLTGATFGKSPRSKAKTMSSRTGRVTGPRSISTSSTPRNRFAGSQSKAGRAWKSRPPSTSSMKESAQVDPTGRAVAYEIAAGGLNQPKATLVRDLATGKEIALGRAIDGPYLVAGFANHLRVVHLSRSGWRRLESMERGGVPCGWTTMPDAGQRLQTDSISRWRQVLLRA